jgi:hypothetical protein
MIAARKIFLLVLLIQKFKYLLFTADFGLEIDPGILLLIKQMKYQRRKLNDQLELYLKMLKCQILINNEMMGRSFCLG